MEIQSVYSDIIWLFFIGREKHSFYDIIKKIKQKSYYKGGYINRYKVHTLNAVCPPSDKKRSFCMIKLVVTEITT